MVSLKVAYNMEIVKKQNLPIFMVDILKQTLPKSDLEKDSQLDGPHKIYSRFYSQGRLFVVS